MAVVNTINGDVVIVGGLYGLTDLQYPAASILNGDISAAAAIAASKCQKSLAPALKQAGTATDETRIVRVVKGATGTIKHFTVSNVTACAGASTLTVDLQNNGVSVLAAPVTLNAATGNLGEAVGVISTPALVDGDVLTIVVVTSQSGTDALATGVFGQVDLDEDYAA